MDIGYFTIFLPRNVCGSITILQLQQRLVVRPLQTERWRITLIKRTRFFRLLRSRWKTFSSCRLSNSYQYVILQHAYGRIRRTHVLQQHRNNNSR